MVHGWSVQKCYRRSHGGETQTFAVSERRGCAIRMGITYSVFTIFINGRGEFCMVRKWPPLVRLAACPNLGAIANSVCS